MKLYAVIPTRNRHGMVYSMIRQLLSELVEVIVVDNGSDPPISVIHPGVHLLSDPQQPPNLSVLWNRGLTRAHNDFARRRSVALNTGDLWDYAVAVLNDDLVLPPRFVQTMAAALEETGAAVAYPDQFGALGPSQIRHVHLQPGPVDLRTRMCGYAFVLRGSAGLRADENLQWWYGDDDLDWRARQNGGSCLVGGIQVQHMHPNESTNANPELGAQAGRDRQTFIDKWGKAPW